MFAIIGLIAAWAVLIGSFSSPIGRLPGAAQLILYLVLGIAWIAPLKPLLAWMETGRWRH